MNNKKYIFFWHGIYSNWHPSEFVVDKIKYNCSEQYMMQQKALLFNDYDTVQKIMQAITPKEQKVLGRSVKGYDNNIWELHRFNIVLKGVKEKFKQNLDLWQELKNTNDAVLVEASPYDTIWGIGMSADDPNIYDESKWKGLNLLGKVLMQARSELLIELE